MQNRLKWDRRMNMGAQNLNLDHQHVEINVRKESG